MSTDNLLELVDLSTSRLLRDLADLTDAEAREPSLLPGWSRGHVLTHIARNADALVNLLRWARTGERAVMYPSRAVRAADIEAGARRSVAELRADLAVSHERLREYAELLDADAWTRRVEWGADRRGDTAEFVLVLRASEVELHRTDLGMGYPPALWPAEMLVAFLPYAASDLAERAGEALTLQATDTWATLELGDRAGGAAARTVEGPQAALAAWVTGRSDGHDLAVVPDGDLPDIGGWR
ncbi:MAG TPA: maleylpyruvate isomerase family mycothiol-dependent enzyme [Nocardioidaceae bacterium]|nr:maleylpyruvate isomerase family mycothiol-dependent enzyme [Nocardioidaceae bacterium]